VTEELYPSYKNTSNRSFYGVFKRSIDLVGGILGIIVLSPLLILIALLVRFSSEGPVFFKGIRTGRFGKQFTIIKFRSMVVGSDLQAGTTSRNDPRITRVGKVIRRYKLDELPQLFNVLRGEMSLVGPRPELPYYTDQYRGEERLILSVRPGITDFSSIEFSNLNDLIDDGDPDRSFEEKILKKKNRLRVKYVKEQNFLLDISLIFKTLLKLINR